MEPDVAFVQGYLDTGGDPALTAHFLRIITICEGARWEGYHGAPYWTRAQFSGDTWAKVAAYLVSVGVGPDPDNPYATGRGVGWWSQRVDPGGRGGWPVCFWLGGGP